MSDNFTTQFEGFFELSITIGLFLLSFAIYIEASKQQDFMRLNIGSHVLYLTFDFIPAIGLMVMVTGLLNENFSVARCSATIFAIGALFLLNMIPFCTEPAETFVPCYANKDLCYNTHDSQEDLCIH